MSRTYKDAPSKIRFPEGQYNFGRKMVAYVAVVTDYYTNEPMEINRYRYISIPGAKTKKKKHVNTEWHWMTTPMWWIREMMNRPQRARGKAWEKKVAKTEIEYLDDLNIPDVGRKPHIYYW